MKELVKMSRTTGYLEKLFREINRDWFGGEVEEPIITVQSTPGAHGHVTVNSPWKVKGEDSRHELNLSAETVNRPIENVCATLIHEMCHLLNMQHGIQDTSRGNTYHNGKFRDCAEAHGIHVDKDERYGWTITSPTEELIDWIITRGLPEVQIGRGNGWSPAPMGGSKSGAGTGTPGKKPSSTRKYVCPCCGQSIRATKAVNIICGDCMQQMVQAV